jgi:phosphatidylserine/phosphatidylglycerophosphate/cardiolipin synthase-like enzyme
MPSLRFTLILFSCIFLFNAPNYSAEVRLSSAPVQVYFSPNGGCTEGVVNTLDKAKDCIYVQAYSFTSRPIADALIRAKKRIAKVTIILDKGQETAKSSMLFYVNDAGIDTYLDKKHAIAHNKIMIIDGHILITGSFNFTSAAESKNAENLLIVDSKELAKQYYNNFLTHKKHSIRCN